MTNVVTDGTPQFRKCSIKVNGLGNLASMVVTSE